MNKTIIFALLLAVFQFSYIDKSSAQSIEVVGGNMLNGALTGSILGAATMGLQDDSGFAPLRIGIGSGILAGAGIAIYDIATLPQGQELFVAGLFNDGNNSSIIILLDTVYGASIGAALGPAVVLISNDSLLDGLRYGASYGAWTGFGFGLIDSFFIAERNRDFLSNFLQSNGELLSFSQDGYQLGFVRPDIITYKNLGTTDLSVSLEPVVNLISFRKSF